MSETKSKTVQQSLPSMESSELTILDMTKIQIISNNLSKMDEKRMEVFKKSLCQLKPRRGAGRIKMGNIKDKPIKQMVEFVFRYHTDKRAAATIRMALEKTNENQIKMLINKDLRSASKIGKTGKNEANKSNKNMETEKNEEPPQVNLTHGYITNNSHSRTPNKQLGAALSITSSKEPPQVHQTQGNVANNILIIVPKQQFVIASSHTSSKEPPQVNPAQDNFTNHPPPRAPNQQLGLARSLTSSKEQPQVSTTQSKITKILLLATNQQYRIASSHTSKELPPQVNPKQSSTANIIRRASNKQFRGAPSKALPDPMSRGYPTERGMLPRGPSEQFQATPSHISSKELPPQVIPKQSSTANIIRRASKKQCKEQPQVNPIQGNIITKKLFQATPSHISSKGPPPQVIPKQSSSTNIIHRATDEQFRGAPSKELTPQVIPKQSSIANIIRRASNEQFRGAPSKELTPQVIPKQSSERNIIRRASNKQFRGAPSKEQPQVNPIQGNITTMLPRGPNEQFQATPLHISSKASHSKSMIEKQDETNVCKIASTKLVPTCDVVPCSEPSAKNMKQGQIRDAELEASKHNKVTASKNEEHRQVQQPIKQVPPPEVNPKQSSATKTIHRASNEQFRGAPSEEQQQVKPTQHIVTKNTLPRAPSEKYGAAPSYTSSKEPPPQVKLKQNSATYTGASNKHSGVASAKVKEHFVDRHRRDLINRMYELQRILDDLLKRNVLTQRQHVSICSKTTHRAQIRALYDYVRDWSDGHKDELYDLLQIYNQSLILNLIHQEMFGKEHFVDKHRVDLINEVYVLQPVLDDL